MIVTPVISVGSEFTWDAALNKYARINGAIVVESFAPPQEVPVKHRGVVVGSAELRPAKVLAVGDQKATVHSYNVRITNPDLMTLINPLHPTPAFVSIRSAYYVADRHMSYPTLKEYLGLDLIGNVHAEDGVMNFSPDLGEICMSSVLTMDNWRAANPQVAVLFNPYTGVRRSAAEVGTDPFGKQVKSN